MPTPTPDRRGFLLAGGALAIAGGLTALAARITAGTPRPPAVGYGPLHPAKDENTGLTLIKLPDGFRYRSFGWAKDKMGDGTVTPHGHDGMAVVKADGDRLTLIRNHEISGRGKAFGDPKTAYDPAAPGGCSTVVFDTAASTADDARSRVSLNGTLHNCSGGATPWGTWLSGEENVRRRHHRGRGEEVARTPEGARVGVRGGPGRHEGSRCRFGTWGGSSTRRWPSIPNPGAST